jgi:hypothetical protein
VRHVLLPLIQTRYPGAPRALSDLARSARADVEVLDLLTRALAMQATATDREIRLDRLVFRQAPGAVQRRTIRWAASALARDAEISLERTEAVVDLFLNGRKGQKVELTGGLVAFVDRDTLVVAKITP